MYKISKMYLVMKLYMFRESSVPIIRSYLLYCTSRVRLELSSNLTLLGSVHITRMKRTSCRV
jgi:hypothetical protein